MKILQISFYSSILILLIIVIRSVALYKLPKRMFSVLWIIVSVRLIALFSIPNIIAKIINYSIPPNTTSILVPKTYDTVLVIPHIQNTIYSINGLLLPRYIPTIMTTIWKVVMFILVMYFIISYFKHRQNFKMSIPVSNEIIRKWKSNHPLWRRIEIRQTDYIASPLTYGIIHPVILLPDNIDWSNETDIDFILLHEYIHIKNFDSVSKFIYTLSLCIHWFNPLVWVMYILANRDIEISCDNSVIKSNFSKKYAMALIRMEQIKTIHSPIINYFNKNSIEERIEAIMNTKRISKLGCLLAILIVISASTVFATDFEEFPTKTDTHSPKLDGVEWWTYDEYNAWVNQKKLDLQAMIGEQYWTPGTGWKTWNESDVDAELEVYNQILIDLKNGKSVSKSVDGSDNIQIGYDPTWSSSAQEYELSVTLPNGEEAHFGPYETYDDLSSTVYSYLDDMIEKNVLSQEEARKILSEIM